MTYEREILIGQRDDAYVIDPSVDRVELAPNRLHRASMRLFEKLKEDMGNSPFTLEEIRDAYNRYVGIEDKGNKVEGIQCIGVRFTQTHLNYLLENGFVTKEGDDYSLSEEFQNYNEEFEEEDYGDESFP